MDKIKYSAQLRQVQFGMSSRFGLKPEVETWVIEVVVKGLMW